MFIKFKNDYSMQVIELSNSVKQKIGPEIGLLDWLTASSTTWIFFSLTQAMKFLGNLGALIFLFL